MQGSLDPWLRFVAETTIDDVDVQVIIEGLASAPEVRFASSPDLPQEEIVARLIFGRGLDNISPLQAAQLASAVAKLSGGGSGLVGRLRSGFGLSDLDVKQTAEGDTEVSAGTYISDKIYTEVTADSAGRQKINLNLDLSRNLTAKGSAASDGDAGIGIFFEKDY
jgi:translocation and assembly module TamB